MALISDRVSISFRTPFITNRIARNTKSVSRTLGEGEKEVPGKDLSPNEKEDSGGLPGGAWNNLDDQTDDAHLYLGKFQSFLDMIDILIDRHGCRLIVRETVKLPRLGDGKKHWLADTQNPRCLAFVGVTYKNQSFTLLEVDTSDGAAKLSTMLVKTGPDWVSANLNEIRLGILKKSLGWPSDLFRNALGESSYSGIPHPNSKHSGALPPEEIAPWAQRVANWISRDK